MGRPKPCPEPAVPLDEPRLCSRWRLLLHDLLVEAGSKIGFRV